VIIVPFYLCYLDTRYIPYDYEEPIDCAAKAGYIDQGKNELYIFDSCAKMYKILEWIWQRLIKIKY